MLFLSTLVAVAILLTGCLGAAAQDAAAQLRFPRKPDDIVRYESMSEIPDVLLNVLRRMHCWLEPGPKEKEMPVVAFRAMPGGYVTYANCQQLGSRGYMFWQRTPRSDPQPMWFAMPNASGELGFQVTRAPGIFEWNADTRTLTARQFTDICPAWDGRTTYRPVSYGDHGTSWMLIRVEVIYKPCGEQTNEWQVVWEAGPWPTLSKPAP